MVYLSNTHAYIENNTFLDNRALSCVGLKLLCPLENCIWSLIKNSFKFNQALKEGGGYCWEKYLPFNDSTNIFENNSANTYGPDRTSPPI